MPFEALESIRQAENLSIRRLCHLTGLSRASYYRWRDATRRRKRQCQEPGIRDKAIGLSRRHGHYGYRKIWALLGQERFKISPITVYRWLKEEGLLLAPKYHREVRRLERAARKKYFRRPDRPNELWQVDVTFVDLGEYGIHYVINVIDYASRFPLVSMLSATHTTEDIIRALEKALNEARSLRGLEAQEIILVSDNGPQFTSKMFRRWAKRDDNPFRHVRGRSHHPQSIGMVERYHQSLKYEEIWRNDYDDPIQARQQIEHYRVHYAYKRPHQALDYDVPAQHYVIEKSGDPLRKTA